MFNSKSIKHGTFDRGSQGTSILLFKAVNYIYLVFKSHALSHLDFINSVARSDCHCRGTGEAEWEERDQEDWVDLIYMHELSSMVFLFYLLLISGESDSFMHWFILL